MVPCKSASKRMSLFPAFPGPPGPPKIVSAYKDCINLKWLAPSNTGGSITGYNVEKRKKGSNFWSQVNPKDEPIRGLKKLHCISLCVCVCVLVEYLE